MTEWKPEPQTPEQVEQGLKDAMKQAKEDGVFDRGFDEMTNQDYVIQECLDDDFKEYFVILRVKGNEYILVSPKHFDTFEEAKNTVRLLRKHKQPIYHYVHYVE